MTNYTPQHLGGGTVLFSNAITVPQAEVIEYLVEQKDKWRKENFTLVHDENGKPTHAVNKGGFIYGLEDVMRAPVRVQELEHPFFEKCDTAIYSCLLEYIEMFPAILQCLWWRSTGHVLCYDEGASLGFHCDNDVNYRYGAIPKTEHATRNVLSALVYFNDSTDDESVPNSFSGGNMTIPYFDIDIKPRTGDILLMPANYLGAHEIHAVTRGSRYSYLSWFAQGSESEDKGICPMVPDTYYKNHGQWWMTSIVEDYAAHLEVKYENSAGIPDKLLDFKSRKNDHT